jgi:hypothetical protein
VSILLAPGDNADGCYQWELSSKHPLATIPRSNCTGSSACKDSSACDQLSTVLEFELRIGYRFGPSFAISVTSTAKQEAQSSVGKPLQGGYRAFRRPGRLTPHPSHTISLPTLSNLACIPLGVNHLDGREHAKRPHRWLPAPGTFGAQQPASNTRVGWLKTTIVRIPKKAVSRESFYLVRRRHRQGHRERFIELSLSM